MKRCSWIMVVVLNMSFVPSMCYIYQIHVLQRWNNDLQQYQCVIGLSDFHDKSHPTNKVHRRYLERMLFRLRQHVQVIVEDLSSAGSDGRLSCGQFAINSRGGVLGGLANVCRSMKIPVENIEYRYCRVVALSPLINNLYAPIDSFSSSNVLCMNALYREVLNEIETVRSYNDGRVLGRKYRRCINSVLHLLKNLQIVRYRDFSVAAYCKKRTTSRNRLDFLQTLCTFDSDLLDLKLVHTVLGSQDKKYIIAVAGGTHIKHAYALLQNAGYKSVFTLPVESMHEYNLSKCLGSHIVDDAFCIKPKPANITILDQLLDATKNQ